MAMAAANWREEFSEKLNSSVSRTIVLHNNTQDYVYLQDREGNTYSQTLRQTLSNAFRASFELVVFYSRGGGFWFPEEAHRDRFLQIVGLRSGAVQTGSASGNNNPSGGTGIGRGLAAAISQQRPVSQGAGGSSSDELTRLENIGKQPAQALAYLSKLLAYNDPDPRTDPATFKVAVVIEHAETICPAGAEATQSDNDRTAYVHLADWGRDSILGAQGNINDHKHAIVLVVQNMAALSEPLLRAGWEPVEITLPTYEERLSLVHYLSSHRQSQPAVSSNSTTSNSSTKAKTSKGSGKTDDNATNKSAAATSTTTQAGATYLESAQDPDLFIAALAEGVTAEEVAQLTTGLGHIHIEDIFLKAAYLDQPVDLSLVKWRKEQLIATEYNQVLEIVDSPFGFEAIGGHAEIKEFLTENVVIPMRNGLVKGVPQGILLVGPPGTAKTMIARALGKESSVTFIKFNLSRIMSKWVGDSEKQLERYLKSTLAMAPCILFADEIDQLLQRGESQAGDSGVSNRIFGRFMEFAADPALRGKVLVFGATNRPDLIDSAMRRAGRFDVIIPVLPPGPAERVEVLGVKTRQLFADTPQALAQLLQAETEEGAADPTSRERLRRLAFSMEGYTGAEIEAVVVKAARFWHKAGGAKSVIEVLEEAHTLTLPRGQDFAALIDLALMYCSDLELIPEQYRQRVRELRQREIERLRNSLNGNGGSNSVSAGSGNSEEQPATVTKPRRRAASKAQGDQDSFTLL